MTSALALAVSAALAQLLTNLDNLALLFAILPALGVVRAVTSYVLAQVLVLGAALLIATGAADLSADLAGYCSAPIKMRNYANQVRNRRNFPVYFPVNFLGAFLLDCALDWRATGFPQLRQIRRVHLSFHRAWYLLV